MARKVYTDEFKVAAAKLVRQQGYSAKAAAESLGIDPGSVRDWVRKFAPEPAASTPDASADELRRQNPRLRQENRRLLMEREILPLNASIARPPISADSPSEAGRTRASA